MKQIVIVFLCLILAPAYSSESTKITVDPDTLRSKLLEGNIPILVGLNHIHQAKDRVNIARGNLLPSVNLTAVLSVVANPMFALGAIEFLAPFLIPSKWFDFFQSKGLMEAEKQSYWTLQLNMYASALSLYHIMLGDQDLYKILEGEYLDLREIYEILKRKDEILGTVSETDLLHAKAQADQAGARLAKLSQLLIDEKSQLRELLALPIESEISLAPHQLPSSPWEDKSVSEAVDQALKVAPESLQLNSILDAAKNGKWSKVFAFISGASVGTQGGLASGSVQNVSFSNLRANVNVNFGFAYYPAIQLSQKNVEEVQLRIKELKLEQTQVLEKTILGLKKANEEFALSSQAEAQMYEVYKTALTRFELGLETLLNVLLTRKQAAESSVARVQANVLLNQYRITLNRTLIEESFTKLTGCRLDPEIEKKLKIGAWEWLKRKFTGNTGLSIDQACGGKI